MIIQFHTAENCFIITGPISKESNEFIDGEVDANRKVM